MKKSVISLSFVIIFSFSSYSQENQDEFKIFFKDTIAGSADRYTSSLMMPTRIEKDISFFSGIPTQFSLYRVYSVTVNQELCACEDHISGDKCADDLKRIEGNSTLPDTRWKYLKNKFHIYVALDKIREQKHIIVDTNNNLDFSDDESYSFSTKDYDRKSWHIIDDSLTLYSQVDISNSIEKRKVIHSKINFKILPYDAYNGKSSYLSEDEYFLNILVATTNYKQAKIKIADQDLYINESSNRFSFIPEESISNKSTFYLFTPQDSVFPNTSRIGDTVLVANRKLHLQNKKGDLFIKDLGSLIDSSRVGDFLPDLYVYSIEDSRRININTLTKGKYIFIDFWGSWCKPCIEAFPHLVDLHQKIKDREDVLMVGVALENEKDIENLKKIMHDNGVGWLNFFGKQIEMKQMDSIFSKLKIENFPTYIILDKSGKIVFRERSSFKTEEAIISFLNLIGQ